MDASRRLSASLLTCALVGSLAACSGRSAPNQPTDPQQQPRNTQSNVITADQIREWPTSVSVEELIARLVPGVRIQRRNDGSIGLQIASLSSGGNTGEPLFVVDGVPVRRTGGALGLNPRDVERIEVLKDGGSTAAYGFRGTYGVILITTKHNQ